MMIYRFDEQSAMEIRAFDSINLRMSRIVETSAQAHIGCMHIGPKGRVGYHQATEPQLFIESENLDPSKMTEIIK